MKIDRRKFLSIAGITALAGCIGNGDDEDGGGRGGFFESDEHGSRDGGDDGFQPGSDDEGEDVGDEEDDDDDGYDEEDDDDDGYDEEEDPLGDIEFHYDYTARTEELTIVHDQIRPIRKSNLRIEVETGDAEVNYFDEWRTNEELVIEDIRPDQHVTLLYEDEENDFEYELDRWVADVPDLDFEYRYFTGQEELTADHVGGDGVHVDFLVFEGSETGELEVIDYNGVDGVIRVGNDVTVDNARGYETVEIRFEAGEAEAVIDEVDMEELW